MTSPDKIAAAAFNVPHWANALDVWFDAEEGLYLVDATNEDAELSETLLYFTSKSEAFAAAHKIAAICELSVYSNGKRVQP